MEELLAERGLAADHTKIWRWIQRYAPQLEQRLRRRLKPTNKSWWVDETYIKGEGSMVLSIRSHDSTGATVSLLLSAQPDVDVARRLFRNALSDPSLPQPRVINMDLVWSGNSNADFWVAFLSLKLVMISVI